MLIDTIVATAFNWTYFTLSHRYYSSWAKLDSMKLTSAIVKAAEFNNAGVSCFRAGNPRQSWELFKGALEVKLAIERFAESESRPEDEPLYVDLSGANRYVARAEQLLLVVSSENISNASVVDPNSGMNADPSRPEASYRTRKRIGGEEHCDIFYTPFLFTKPFPVPDQGSASPHEMARSTSAVIIFNLALLDHLFNRPSRQTLSLYLLASNLMVGEVVDALGLALINNIGVWCYENDDIEAAQRCLDHLSRILRSPNISQLVDSEARSAVMRNVVYMLSPQGSASAAA